MTTIRKQPLVYVEFEFLKSFYKNYLSKSALDLQQAFPNKSILLIINFISDLLFTNSNLGVDVDENEKFEPESLEEMIFNNLISANLISSKAEIEKLKRGDPESEFGFLPNYVFLNESWEVCKELESLYGIKFNSNEIEKWDVSNCRVEVETMLPDPTFTSLPILNKLYERNKSNSFIFLDKYLVTNVVNNNNTILDDLKKAFRIDSDSRFSCFVLSNYNIPKKHSKNEYVYVREQIKERYKEKFQFLNINEKFHDRYLLSSSYWVSCGLGFQGIYQKPTEWIIYPIGYGSIYFDKMQEIIKNTLSFQNDGIPGFDKHLCTF